MKNIKHKILLAIASGINRPSKLANTLETSLQNIRNHLSRLRNEGIVKKKGKEYFLTDKYIEYLSDIYSKISTLTFKNLYELDKYIFGKILNAKECRAYWNHLYLPVAFPEKFDELTEILKKMKLYFVCEGTTHWDKKCAKKYEELGAKVKLGYKICFYNLAITENHVFEIFYPKEIYEAWDKIYNIEDYVVFARDFHHFYHKTWNNNIVVKIDKNKTLSESFKKRFDTIFSELK